MKRYLICIAFFYFATHAFGQTTKRATLKRDTTIVQISDSLLKVINKKGSDKQLRTRNVPPLADTVHLSEKEKRALKKELSKEAPNFNVLTSSQQRKLLSELIQKISHLVLTDSLIATLQLNNTDLPPSDIEYRVEKIPHYKVVYEVYERFQSQIDFLLSTQIPPQTYLNGLLANLEIVRKHMNLLLQQQFVFYRYTSLSKQFIKSVNLYHDNDFLLFSKINQDRDYTGGFRFEFTTDYFKMRLFRPWNTNNILSYQSIMLGGEGYTPYIRFQKEEVEAATRQQLVVDANTGYFTPQSMGVVSRYMDSIQTRTDRPFASFQYIARGKYRLNQHGHWRSRSFFKLGIIGGNIGKNLQAIIHQDLTVGSIRVMNWEKQIANGGRLGFNIDHHVDLMLLSPESTVFKKEKYLDSNYKKKPYSLNVYLPVEIHTGSELDAWGVGVGVSNRNFKDRSGTNDLKLDNNRSQPWYQRWYNNCTISTELRYRNVIHNSMLEGVGWFKTWEDDVFDNEAPTVYKLRASEVNRHLLTWDCFIGIRFYKVSVYYMQTRTLNAEFNKMILNQKSPESKGKPYGWARIGFNFLI